MKYVENIPSKTEDPISSLATLLEQYPDKFVQFDTSKGKTCYIEQPYHEGNNEDMYRTIATEECAYLFSINDGDAIWHFVTDDQEGNDQQILTLLLALFDTYSTSFPDEPDLQCVGGDIFYRRYSYDNPEAMEQLATILKYRKSAI